jgi:hypothetical protein
VHLPLVRAVRNRAQPGNRGVISDSGEFLRRFGGWLRYPAGKVKFAQALRKGEHSGLANRGSIRKSWGIAQIMKMVPKVMDDVGHLVWMKELARESPRLL